MLSFSLEVTRMDRTRNEDIRGFWRHREQNEVWTCSEDDYYYNDKKKLQLELPGRRYMDVVREDMTLVGGRERRKLKIGF